MAASAIESTFKQGEGTAKGGAPISSKSEKRCLCAIIEENKFNTQ